MALTAEISAITEQLFLPKCVDNIFNSNAVMQRLRKKNYRLEDGGTKITQPLLYATTTAGGRYSGMDVLDTTANDQITDAQWDWKQYYGNITISRLDELKNAGKRQIVNFVKVKVQAAEKTLADTLGTDIFSDGTTANSIQGLQLAVATTGTHGEIAKGTYSWWQGSVDTTTTVLTVAVLQGGAGDVTVDNDGPTAIYSTQDLYDAYYGSLQPQQRFQDEETAKGGFKNLLFNGIPFIVDSHCTASELYMINENYMELVAHKDENFRFEPFIKPTNQNAASAKIYWMGGLVFSNCRMNKKFTALT